jgi:ATP-dependent RNA helicase DDX47/RRP3
VAKRELRDALEKGNKKGGIGRGHRNRGAGKRGRDDMDREEG